MIKQNQWNSQKLGASEIFGNLKSTVQNFLIKNLRYS